MKSALLLALFFQLGISAFSLVIIGFIVIVGLIIAAYFVYLKSPEPTSEELSMLGGIGEQEKVLPLETQEALAQEIVSAGPNREDDNEARPTIEDRPAAQTPLTAPLPRIETNAYQIQPESSATMTDSFSSLREELPSSTPRPLSLPKVFTPSAPLPATKPNAPTLAAPPLEAMPPAPAATANKFSEVTLFGTMTEIQRRDRNKSRLMRLIFLLALIGVAIVAYQQIPLVREGAAALIDQLRGVPPPPPPPPPAPAAIETYPLKGTIKDNKLTVQGRVRNISETELTNLSAEILAALPSGLSETRLAPITRVAPTNAKPNEAEKKTLPPSFEGSFTVELAPEYRDVTVKRILREDGSEVKFEKRREN